MTDPKFWNKGGVQVSYREDGTLAIYAPDSSRVLGPDFADSLFSFLAECQVGWQVRVPELTDTEREADYQAELARQQATVPAGEISTATTVGPKPTARRGRPRKASS